MKTKKFFIYLILCCVSVGSVWAQRITGEIIDKSDQSPIIGASIVLVSNKTVGTISDVSGAFSLEIPGGTSEISVSYLGYTTQIIQVNAAQSTHYRIELATDAILLDEVVVNVGYGVQKKVNLTGAVSAVDVSKTLEARPQSDISKALQGVVPGLTILNSTGQLGTAPTISIRGVGTLSNNATSNPLIVVDGVPMEDISYLNTQDIQDISVLKDAASTSIYGTRAAFGVILITTKSAKTTDRLTVSYTNNFAWDTPTMLPNYPDVATQVRALRDANVRDKLSNELFGMNMDDDFIAKAEDWKQRHGGKKAGYREMVLGDDFDMNPTTGVGNFYADWDVVGIMFRDWKPSQSHNLQVQGASGKTAYFMSMGYNHEEGVFTFNPDKMNKYNTMMNVTTNLTSWLQLGGRFSYSDKILNRPNARRLPYQYMWRWGSFFGPYGTYNGYDMNNAIAHQKQAGDNVQNNSYTRMGAFLKADIIKGLTLNADYTYNIVNFNQDEVGLPVYALNSWGADIRTPSYISAPSASYLRQQNTRDHSYALNVYANYALTVAENNNFNLMVGANAEEGENRMFWSRRNVLLDKNLPEFSLATGDQTVGGSHTHWGSSGWFGRLNYDYKGIWLLELNGRYDGSSKFPASGRWAFFPSGSFGYRLSEESYFDALRETINNFKIRGSFGQIGNQAIGDYMFVSTITGRAAGDTYWLDAAGTKVVAYNLPSLVSTTLKWERIQTLDIGLDISFLNQFNLSADWYQRSTLDMLAPSKVLPQTLGANAPVVNAGALRTRGWELSIDWGRKFGEVNVYAQAGIGDFKTVITQWETDSKLLNSNYTDKVYGDIWGFETDRLFTKDDFNLKDDGTVESYKPGIASQTGLQQGNFIFGPGDIKLKDLNGDGVIDGGTGTAEDHGDLKVIGNTTPRYQYNFRIGGAWRGFDLDMFFQGVGKRDIWTQSAFVMPMMRGADAIYANQTNYWSEENQDPNAEFPRMFPTNAGQGTISVIDRGQHNFYPQTKYLFSAAYLRFKNLTVGYTLPASISRKAYLSKIRVYFSANNIMELIDNNKVPIDPEINTSESTLINGVSNNDFGNGTWGRIDPLYRTVSFGLQVTF
ncbi:MAG: TonB-dependent receptor [Tannerella sp.]|jgi:TonB-linked SusC/RagA family outer membrane protein|nr:TonB-dependent receptor [Tannerella sp.]